ncbi:DUF3102 domain-containing protein [Desulfosporosinus lacus]|uniref:DUF3102 domain-containing protein n=1 Tax=Desulfosporosinus lacus TaxID=329936 RepID=UPI000A01E23A
MQLCEEQGTKLLASLDSGGNPNSSMVTNLTCTQALVLLGIPEEERFFYKFGVSLNTQYN